jgi:hypothetical protein
MDRQTDRQRNTKIYKLTEKHTDGETDREA